jgi:hypothetical protein
MNRPSTISVANEATKMSTTLPPRHAQASDVAPTAAGGYSRYAEVFSRVYRETGSIEIALEVYDTFRAREDVARVARPDLPDRILELAGSLFHVPKRRLLERNRHRDVTSARYVAAWLLSRQKWSTVKIGALLDLDHSTVLHGLRRVAGNDHLLIAAHKAEQLLELPVDVRPLASVYISHQQTYQPPQHVPTTRE